MFHFCFSEVKRVLKQCYLGVTEVFLGCHKVVTRVFQWSDMQECHIRSEISRVKIQEQQAKVTSQELQVKSEKSRVAIQELQLKGD